jgi:hypothetical protein
MKEFVFVTESISILTEVFAHVVVAKTEHGGRAVSGMNRLRPLERWECGFESHSRHGCLCVFILCLCFSVCR